MTRHPQSSLPSHAIDALPACEASGVDRHLGKCGTCRREIDRFRGVAAMLVPDLESIPAPPRFAAFLAGDRRVGGSGHRS